MALYVLDEFNNKIEVTDKVLSAIVQQVVCCVSNTPHSMAFVTQAKYNELKAAGTLVTNGIYFITDDTTADDIDAQLATLTTNLNAIMQGTKIVPNATNASYAKKAELVEKLNLGYTTLDGMDLKNIFEFDEDDYPTGRVWEAASAEEADRARALGTSAITPLTNGTVRVSKAGLYACVCENSTYPNVDRVTLLISIENFKECNGQSYYYNNKTVFLYSMGGTENTTIYAYPASASYKIVSCRLITEY